MQIQHCS